MGANKVAGSLLWFTDIHLASENPISRRDDYQESLLDKISQVMRLAQAVKVDRVICGGDVWHSKSPVRTTHYTIQRLIDLWKQNPPLGVIGNHDIPWGTDDYTRLDRQPLGVMVKAGAYELCEGTHEIGPFAVRGVHWSPSDLKPKHLAFDSEFDDLVRVLMLHVNASVTGSDFPGNDLCYSYQWLADNSNADVICLGHWHRDQGIQKVGKTYFVNVGSLSRVSTREENLTRKPSAALIQVKEGGKISIQQVHLKFKPAAEVFDLDKKQVEKSREIDVTAFVERLSQGNIFQIDVAQLIDQAEAEQVVKEKARELYDKS